jgi:hypothetical protein
MHTAHLSIGNHVNRRQVLRMWMPYDSGFLVFQPHVRNATGLALRRTDGCGASAIAQVLMDK